MLIALMRGISPRLADCELTFLDRTPINLNLAIEQHCRLQKVMEGLGCTAIVIPSNPALPDATFIEDATVVLDEVAVITLPGAISRRPETAAVAEILSHFRPLQHLQAPATLEGGDVVRVERKLYVGVSTRTNREGIEQLRQLIAPYDYEVIPVEVTDCLHLKTGATYLGNQTWLVNRDWFDAGALRGFRLLDVPPEEPWAANTMTFNNNLYMPAGFPRTQAMLEGLGYQVATIEMSEMQKAEAGLTCLSVIFEVK